MKTYNAKILLDDETKISTPRRYRNILANSGKIMESGEIRDVKNLFVMDFDGNLIRISDLSHDPEAQEEKYAVKAQADHGELIDGEPTPTIEKQFGSCRVWLEEDGLHARMYFANDDELANHAWAISEDASYSTGIDWFPDGYYGAGYEISEPIGILREVSMVLTGNDPRAKTIDQKPTSEAETPQGEEQTEADFGNEEKTKGESDEMKKLDALTPDEKAELMEELSGLVDKYTTSVPEGETEPTAKPDVATKDEAEEPAEESPEANPEETNGEEKTADALKMPTVIIKDKIKQEIQMNTTTDWVHSAEGHKVFADTLKKAGRFGATFDNMWANEAKRHIDDITGLGTPAPLTEIIVSELESQSGIISHFEFIDTKSLRVRAIAPTDADSETARAHGHTKGNTKISQELTATTRDVLAKMVYKKLDLDATELWENPFLVDFRARELVREIVKECERAAIIGDGRTSGTPDYRMFDGTRGFYSVKADAAADNNAYATSITLAEGDNLYDAVIKARAEIKTEGRLFVVAKSSAVTSLRTAKTDAGAYLVTVGASLEQLLDVEAVFTPSWMDAETNIAYVIVDNAYKMIGESGMTQHTDFDTTNNTDVLLAEAPRGGSLGSYRSAVAIAPYAA